MDADAKLRRLMARGHCEVIPGTVQVPSPHWDDCAPGCLAEHSILEPGVTVMYCSHGQRHRHGWNPFATRSVTRHTLTEALDVMLEATTPRWDTLSNLVEKRQAEIRGLIHFMCRTRPCEGTEEYSNQWGRWVRYCAFADGHLGGHSFDHG